MKQLKNEVFLKGLVQAAVELGALPLPPVASIRVSRLLRALDGPSKDYANARKKIYDKFYEKDPEKPDMLRLIKPEVGTLEAQLEEVNGEFETLNEITFDLPADFDQPIRLNFSKWDAQESGKYNLSAACLNVLDTYGLIEVT